MKSPEEQRRFALEVVDKLRAAGFVAYLAGGCVRDQLLGRTPKDYDVATNATPQEIRKLFGHRRTIAVGAAFGVITVIGPKAAGMVEVATFRRDAAYTDGRHPDHVTFSSAEEDASRRDFTINGLFFDPVEQKVIDYVGGKDDLAEHRIRAIGDAHARFAEDKLRMLRAVRFASTFDFTLDEAAFQAIREMAAEIHVVSPERIAMEMRRILVDAHRTRAIQLLLDTGLADMILPEIVPHDPAQIEQSEQQKLLDRRLQVLSQLHEPSFPLAFAALLDSCVTVEQADAICRRWRLSNQETDRILWLLTHRTALQNASTMRWSAIQPILIAEGAGDLLDLMAATSPEEAAAATHCRTLLDQPRDVLDPPPLLTGGDLLAMGIPAGPQFKTL
jgi:poly(A) polymerase